MHRISHYGLTLPTELQAGDNLEHNGSSDCVRSCTTQPHLRIVTTVWQQPNASVLRQYFDIYVLQWLPAVSVILRLVDVIYKPKHMAALNIRWIPLSHWGILEKNAVNLQNIIKTLITIQRCRYKTNIYIIIIIIIIIICNHMDVFRREFVTLKSDVIIYYIILRCSYQLSKQVIVCLFICFGCVCFIFVLYIVRCYLCCMLCCFCNWPSGCWFSTLINQNWIELNWIIIITIC
jgi:hypothetical protein